MASTDGAPVAHAAVPELEIGRHRGSLSGRIVGVAVVSVLVAMAVSLAVAFPLVRNAAVNQAREVLARQADTVAQLFGRDDLHSPDGDEQHEDRPFPGPQPIERVTVVLVNPASAVVPPFTAADVARLTSGRDLSDVREYNGHTYFIEGRALATGEGVLLVQRSSVAEGPASTLLTRMAIALAIGLIFAAAIAILVARRTAQPMRRAAEAASRLAQGDRDVSVTVEGAVEVADIARALNRLAAALALSEDRQREFLMSVSHELRTPMTSIKGYAEALADGVIDAAEMQSVGGVLLAEGERLDRLVSDLLDLSRTGAVDFHLNISDTDLGEIARHAADSWALRCNRAQLGFVAHIDQTPMVVAADPTRVRQIIDNLIENAVRVTPDGGTVQLRCQLVPTGVQLSIEDTGPGLTDDDMEVAFQPAVLNSRYRTARQVGTGLGLALVGRLAERMGATAVAGHSQLGGARFDVNFPSRLAQ